MLGKLGSANIKLLLLALSMAIVIALLLYTQSIVTQLQEREYTIANLSAKAYEYLGKDPTSEYDITFIFEEIIQKDIADFPIIIADPQQENYKSKNIDIPDEIQEDFDREQVFLRQEAEEMAKETPPIVLKSDDTTVVQYVYYAESDLVKALRVLPYIEIFVATLFILTGYLSFSYIKRHEQANIWVGMSKETAHQLGTPLSSLAGWLELLNSQTGDPEALSETINEMESDIGRLNRIAHRFSKIGAQPDLNKQDITETIAKTSEYLRKRLPASGKKVSIQFDNSHPVEARYNAELMEWVFENITKNALDAIGSTEGKISFDVSRSGKYVVVDITDTGKGIEKRYKKDIFRPGYSTKKRGWGLGLSLAKRIVENYHRGKLYVHESAPGKGTTFRMKIPA
ncbi:MAG: two-component sensor histidine kinase [Ectothiorhodospiraceae bacterium]|nr:two-component sensor histidine kinase [Ectothiorhodospiraceae bacterium]